MIELIDLLIIRNNQLLQMKYVIYSQPLLIGQQINPQYSINPHELA